MSTHDIDLMLYADGEAEPTQSDPGDNDKIEAIHHLGELVRGTSELAADGVPEAKFTGMWREIDKLLDNEAAARSKELPISEPERAPTQTEKRGWLSRWFDRYRGYIITGAVSAGVVATIALVVRQGGTDGTMNETGPIDVRPVSLRSPVEVESLDTPNGQGTVLNLEDEDGHTTVIWVSPEDSVDGI
jgi:hypothetical protein